MPLLVRLAACLVAGAAAGLSFEPVRLVYLLPLSVAVLTLCCHGISWRRGGLLGFGFGAAFMLTLLPWLRVIGVDGWVALSLVQAVFYAALGAGCALVVRLRGWPVWCAMLWVGTEALRGSVPFGGFPWGRLGFATIDTPVAPWYAYLGSAGVGFLVALVGTVLAWALLRVRRAPVGSVAGLLVVLLAAGVAAAFPSPVGPGPDQDFSPVSVAAVQGNVPGVGMNAFAERRAVLNNHVEATLDYADAVEAGEARRADLVVWPENSTDIDPFADPSVREDIQDAVDAVGVPTLVGALTRGPDEEGGYRNVGIVWRPDTGPGETYAKRHLVPFGEYIPLRDLFSPYIARLEQVGSDKVPGTEPGALEMDGVTVGDLICFEVAYDGLVRDIVEAGASLVVVQTNNATYIDTGQVEQQFAISRLRAIETGRYVVVAATNGISGIIAPDGEVLSRTDPRTREVLVESVAPQTELTPAVRFGGLLEVLLGLVGAAAVAAALMPDLRRRRRHRKGT